MSYQPVLTDSGLEIRSESGVVVWGPSKSYEWPPNSEMMNAVFADATIDKSTEDILRLLMGFKQVQDERTQP